MKNKKELFIALFSLLISIQFVLGYFLQEKNILFDNGKIVLIEIIILLLCSSIIFCFYKLFEKIKNRLKEKIKENKKENEKEKTIAKIVKKELNINYWCILILIIACWIPIFIAFFPSIFSYDGPGQVYHSYTNTMGNPIIHTFILKMFYVLGIYIFNSATIGIALYSFFQMIIMALIFSYTCVFINKKYKNRILTICSIIFFSLFPINQLFPLITTKDTLFAGLFLLLIIEVFKLKEKDYKLKGYDYVYLTLLVFLTAHFRLNSKCALILFLICLIIKCIKNKKMNFFIIPLVLGMIINEIFNSFFYNYYKYDKKRFILPKSSQIIANAILEHENELTNEEIEEINYYFNDYKKLKIYYKKNLSDNTEWLLDKNKINNSLNYEKLVLKLFFKYPNSSLKAILNTSRGYWYLRDNSFDNIYTLFEDMGALEMYVTHTKDRTELKDINDIKSWNHIIYLNEHEEYMNVKEYNLIPSVKNAYTKLYGANYYRKIPILNIISKPSFYLYLLIIYFGTTIYRKKNIDISILLLVYFITCMMGACSIIRYIYNIIVCVPIILGEIIKKENLE